MANITTNSVVVKSIDPVTGAIKTVPGYEWDYEDVDARTALATVVIPEMRKTGGIIYDRTTVRDEETGVVTSTDTPLILRDETAKTVTGPAWAWYLLLAKLDRDKSDPVSAWLLEVIGQQTELELEWKG